MQSSRSWGVLENERIFKLAMKKFGNLFVEILKYPKMDVT